MIVRPLWLILAAVALQIAAYGLKHIFLPPLFGKRPPDWNVIGLAVMVLSMVSAGLGVWAAAVILRRRLSRAQAGASASPVFSTRTSQLVVGTVLAAGLGCIALFVVSPQAFAFFAGEDYWLENVQAVVCFGAAAGFLLTAKRMLGRFCVRHVAVASIFALAFLLVGLEEVSWFQRVFDFPTPDFLSDNWQKQANFHNLSTNKFEVAYYVSLTVLLVLLPLVKDCGLIPPSFGPVEFFTPSRTVVGIGALAAAYNFTIWNQVPFQTLFFASIFAVGLYRRTFAPEASVPLASAVIAVSILTQVTFLAFPSHHLRVATVAEYKELVLPVGGLVLSVETFLKAGRSRRG